MAKITQNYVTSPETDFIPRERFHLWKIKEGFAKGNARCMVLAFSASLYRLSCLVIVLVKVIALLKIVVVLSGR